MMLLALCLMAPMIILCILATFGFIKYIWDEWERDNTEPLSEFAMFSVVVMFIIGICLGAISMVPKDRTMEAGPAPRTLLEDQ